MKCRCLATAPKKCGQTAYLNGLCIWCGIQSEACRIDHQRNAIAAIWRETYRLAGKAGTMNWWIVQLVLLDDLAARALTALESVAAAMGIDVDDIDDDEEERV